MTEGFGCCGKDALSTAKLHARVDISRFIFKGKCKSSKKVFPFPVNWPSFLKENIKYYETSNQGKGISIKTELHHKELKSKIDYFKRQNCKSFKII